MDNFDNLRNKLIDTLMQQRNAKMTSDEREIYIRCKFCEGGKSPLHKNTN